MRLPFRPLVGPLLLMLLGRALASQDTIAPLRAEAAEAIARGNRQYIDALGHADAKTFAAVYDEHGARLNKGGTAVRGRAAIEADIGAFLASVGTVQVTINTLDLWVIDDQAYETGTWSYHFTPRGQQAKTVGGKYVTIWKRRPDKTWRILVDMGVPDS